MPYILGKYSDAVFTENTNTQCTSETNLLDDEICLTDQVLISSDILKEGGSSTVRTDESTFDGLGETTTVIPKESIDLLEQYELFVCTK